VSPNGRSLFKVSQEHTINLFALGFCFLAATQPPNVRPDHELSLNYDPDVTYTLCTLDTVKPRLLSVAVSFRVFGGKQADTPNPSAHEEEGHQLGICVSLWEARRGRCGSAQPAPGQLRIHLMLIKTYVVLITRAGTTPAISRFLE
jgi:hypothetical protein